MLGQKKSRPFGAGKWLGWVYNPMPMLPRARLLWEWKCEVAGDDCPMCALCLAFLAKSSIFRWHIAQECFQVMYIA
jgi:hypothetical protein